MALSDIFGISRHSSRMNHGPNSLSSCFQKPELQFYYISANFKSQSRILLYMHEDQHHTSFEFKNDISQKDENVKKHSISFKKIWREAVFSIPVIIIIVTGTVTIATLLLLLIRTRLKIHRRVYINSTVPHILRTMDENELPHVVRGEHGYDTQENYLATDELGSFVPENYAKCVEDTITTVPVGAIRKKITSCNSMKRHPHGKLYDKTLLNSSVSGTSSASLSFFNSPSANEKHNDQLISHEQQKHETYKNSQSVAYLESNANHETSTACQELIVDVIPKISIQQRAICPSENIISENSEFIRSHILKSSSNMQNIRLSQIKPINDKNIDSHLPISDDKENFTAFDHQNITASNDANGSECDAATSATVNQVLTSFKNMPIETELDTGCKSTQRTTDQFPLSPKSSQQHRDSSQFDVINNGKKDNSYFRFPEVDVLTPPKSARFSNRKLFVEGSDLEIPYNIVSCASSSTRELSPQCLCISTIDCISNLEHDPNDCFSMAKVEKGSHAYVYFKDNDFAKTRNDRRSRLKSISLDSEGARLVEENFTKSIPVEELVEIAANQSNHIVSGNKLQLQSQTQRQILGSISDNDQVSCKKRNIFNLTLNLNDKDDTLINENNYKFNEIYFEYYDYDDDDYEHHEYNKQKQAIPKDCTGWQKRHLFQMQTPNIPLLMHSRNKANSLDSDRSLHQIQPQFSTYCSLDKEEHQTIAHGAALNHCASFLRTSSLSVPTTPKRKPYRIHQQQENSKPYFCNSGDSLFDMNKSVALERILFGGFQQKLKKFEENIDGCSKLVDVSNKIDTKTSFFDLTQRKEQNLSISNVNLKTLPEVFPVGSLADSNRFEKPYYQTISKSRSSILQRRGSNQSLTLNLDITSGSGHLSKRLSASNYSLGNYKGSRLSLASSSFNLQQQYGCNQLNVKTFQTKRNLLQRRGSNTSLVLNLQGSNNSLNHSTSNNSLNTKQQKSARPARKGLLERRNSNTNLTLFSVQNHELSTSNCNLPGSICSLNSIATYHTHNEQSVMEEEEQQEIVIKECWVPVERLNEPHLMLTCQQHTGRKKFFSSDSLNDIVNLRLECCCTQKTTNMDNSIYHEGQTENSCGK
ncbi:uncharacterized protein LOC129720006 [Wyeomyia smithii]|uniref:uncharacterized protein LOC129720006 n=1 Tax=Wyeomyia smithii TaxID=174621 RepID=UPI002467BFD8|nr:uncharacterized protein LOC129720006 [Wyeomyia smithii]